MAGHSKWANIQHRKGRQDKKRGKLFTKLIREITVAARIGGADQDSNPKLRAAVEKAKSQSMPKDNIERAIAKGSGGDEGINLEEVRHALTKYGGNLGTEGSVAYLFRQIGLISMSDVEDPDNVMEIAIESGAEDIELNDDNSIDVLTAPTSFIDVKDSLDNENAKFEISEITMKALTEISIDRKNAESVLKLMDALEDLDDVQSVHSNAEISEDVIGALN